MNTTDENFFNNDGTFNEAGFEIFFRKYFLSLCAYCQYKYGFSLDLAKDTVQAGFLKLWETRHTVRADLSTKAYLYKIVTNISLDILKHEKVKLKGEKQVLQTSTDLLTNGFENTDLKQLGADIDKAISELPDQMRKVFELCRFEGLKYAEVASQLNISVKTVETQMSRALVKLRQKLSDYLLLYGIGLYYLVLLAHQ